MPKGARKKGQSGFYHVVPKGISDQIIFSDDADRQLYLELLRTAKSETGIVLHAYCLMSNHAHLVLEDPEDNMAHALKYVHERYGAAYAEKSGRTGGVFRRPYWSEPIEDDAYLLCAVRYVHANPAVAGICAASLYPWSSARDYLGKGNGLTDTHMILDMCGGQQGFIRFSKMSKGTALPFPGSKLRAHLNDDEAYRLAAEIVGKTKLDAFASLAREEKDATIILLRERFFSMAQISRIVGLTKSYIQKICRVHE